MFSCARIRVFLGREYKMESVNRLKMHRFFIVLRKQVLGDEGIKAIREDYKLVTSEGNSFIQVKEGENIVNVFQFNDTEKRYSAFDMLEEVLFENDVVKSVQAKVNPIVWKDDRLKKLFFEMFDALHKQEEVELINAYNANGKKYGVKQHRAFQGLVDVEKNMILKYFNEVVTGKKEVRTHRKLTEAEKAERKSRLSRVK